jgi:hypothetical protein
VRDTDEIQQALGRLSATELRSALSAILVGADTRIRASIEDAVMARAAKASTGRGPARQTPSIVAAAQAFAEAACRVGHADPEDVTEHLRLATRAFLAGDYSSARGVFDAILPPIARVDIDLGQHELVDEVLNIDAPACVAQYVASVYLTTPLLGRVDAVLHVIEAVQGIATLVSPIKELEDVLAGTVPDLEVFLPLWVKRLERFRPSSREWEAEQERWLREAVFRVEDVAGLARVARKTKRPQACMAWFDALADRRDWPAALRAADASVKVLRQSHWRGELLDRAALAAQELRRPDLSKRLGAAWKAAPTLARLLRWLAAGDADRAEFRARVTKALAGCPSTAATQVGLLLVLLDDVPGAAAVLAKAPGLGWSDADHPGHALFPLLATLVSTGTVDEAHVARMGAMGLEPLEAMVEAEEAPHPRLDTPSIAAVIQRARSGLMMTDSDCDAAIDAMRIAAEKRVEGVLGHSRRRHYGHAASLVASCVAYAPKRRAAEFVRWVSTLREQYRRRHAFGTELSRACGRLGVRLPAR